MRFQAYAAGERMLAVEDAQARVMAEVAVLGAEAVNLSEAFGRVLREDVVAAEDAPHGDNSAMDGYAVRAEDVAAPPVRLPVIGDIPAGRVATRGLEPRTAMRIMTGALLPDGADTVVQVELTDGGTDAVTIREPVPRGANVRPRGEDMRAGDVVLRAGTRIGAAEIEILAGVGRTSVVVGRRPVVAILETGDELVEPGQPRGPGMIVDTNGPLLAALVASAGAEPRALGIVRDSREATIDALRRAAQSDFVITSGGVSVGAWDFVKDALDALSAETKFWQVAMKPGKPVVLSRIQESVCFGLPGNPASSFVAFHLFVAPALRKAAGEEGYLFAPMVRTRVAAPLRAAARRVYFRVRVVARDGALESFPLARQGSGALTSMVGANGLAMVEANGSVDAGEQVPTLLIGAISGWSPP